MSSRDDATNAIFYGIGLTAILSASMLGALVLALVVRLAPM